MCQITCGACGHAADFEQWLETKAGMVLPAGVFQCPQCKIAIKKTFGPSEIRAAVDGLPAIIVPGKVRLVRVPPRLG